APDAHDHVLRHLRPSVVPRAAAPQIVEEEAGQPDGLARGRPGGPEVADRAPVAMKDMRAFGDPEAPSARPEAQEVPREHERERLLVLRDGARKAHAAAKDGPVFDAQREPGPQGAERIAAPQTRQVGELRRIGHVGCLARAKLREEPREFRRINEALAY